MSGSFPISHDELANQWKTEDYGLTVISDGFCPTCYVEKTDVITQIGVARFDVNVGVCFKCLPSDMESYALSETTVLFAPERYSDPHTISITLDGLKILCAQAEMTHAASAAVFGNGVSQSLSVTQLEIVKKILQSDKVAIALKRMEKPHQCRDCKGLLKEEDSSVNVEDTCVGTVNSLRKNGVGAVVCFCCSELLIIDDDACPMVQCRSCKLTASKICVFCANGGIARGAEGSLVEHNMLQCSQKRLKAKREETPIPGIRLCDCKITHIK